MHYNATCQHGSPLATRSWSCTLVLSDNIMQLHESADCGRVKLIDSFSSVTLICAVDHRFKQCLLEWNEWSVYRVGGFIGEMRNNAILVLFLNH